MTRYVGFLTLLLSGQVPEPLLKYYTPQEVEEIRTLTPQKYEALLYEFTESYEVLTPFQSDQEKLAFYQNFDVRAYQDLRQKDQEVEIMHGAYQVRLKSWQRIQSDLTQRLGPPPTPPNPQTRKRL
ncbi:MAG: hypothetical protein ACUVRD_01920 [Bacteroidia bacterium]